MSETFFFSSVRMWTIPVLVLCLELIVSCSSVQGQSLDEDSPFRSWDLDAALSSASSAPASRVPHLRLFCIAPAFLNDPISLQDDSNLPGVPAMPALAPPDSGPDWIQFGMGSDNPYLDLRRPGDPGGVGFYRVNTQVQLLDSPTTACVLGFQTVTPAGIQFGGVSDGPTVVSPAFSVSHDLGQGMAIQGFVAKNVAISNADGTFFLQRNLQYGMALQRPLLADGPDGWRNFFLSMGALGQVQPDRDNVKLLSTWDVLPGLHWHVNDDWWVSSAVLLPVGPSHVAPGRLQLTCSFRF
jgi:hypothetical protein